MAAPVTLITYGLSRATHLAAIAQGDPSHTNGRNKDG
jgi:hypothetical protein